MLQSLTQCKTRATPMTSQSHLQNCLCSEKLKTKLLNKLLKMLKMLKMFVQFWQNLALNTALQALTNLWNPKTSRFGNWTGETTLRFGSRIFYHHCRFLRQDKCGKEHWERSSIMLSSSSQTFRFTDKTPKWRKCNTVIASNVHTT